MVAAPLPEVAIVPDVLADADAEPPAADVEHLRAVERLEVAVLVEDVVGRQQRFAEALLDAAVAQQHGGVEERPPFVRRVRLGQADQHRRTDRRASRASVASASQLRAHEAGAEQQIARQVADQRQLRRHGQLGAQARAASRAASTISRALPARSPTVGLICRSAIFTSVDQRTTS